MIKATPLILLLFTTAFAYIDHGKHIDIHAYIAHIENYSEAEMISLVQSLSDESTSVHEAFHRGETIDHKYWEETYDKILVSNYVCFALFQTQDCQPKGKFWHKDLDTRGREFNVELVNDVQEVMGEYARKIKRSKKDKKDL